MSSLALPIALSLRDLPAEVELSRPFCETLALAASVMLDHHHGAADRDAAVIHHEDSRRAAEIERILVDDRGRDTYAARQEATEEGAEAIALILARRLLGRIPFQRPPKATGSDYMMRNPQSKAGEDGYERLE